MAKSSAQNFQKSPHVQKRALPKKKHGKAKLPKPREIRQRGWMVAGFDTSMSSIAGAAIGYDRTLDRLIGPVFSMKRWAKHDEYYNRLKDCANSHDIVLELQHGLGLTLNTEEIFIAQEEPWPLGMSRGGLSAFMKQQAEISGAFLGGLMRWGFQNVWQINSVRWRKIVADMITEETGEIVTTHSSKWRSPKLAAQYNCKPNDSGKFRSKQWALNVMEPYFGQQYAKGEIPDWPDIIDSADGKKPRPEKSVAKAIQPDDRYDALAIMWYLKVEEISETLADLTK